jgi:hypothetical protein
VRKPRSIQFVIYNVRLVRALDTLLRDKPRHLGELSSSINNGLLAVDLDTVSLVKLQSRQKQTGRETQVVILRRLRKQIQEVARKRKCSMNQLVNSALLAHYASTGESRRVEATKGHEPPKRLYDSMSEAERRELHQLISGLSTLQPVAPEPEELDGTHYEYDRNLKTTVKVTPDGERYPVETLKPAFDRSLRTSQRKTKRQRAIA